MKRFMVVIIILVLAGIGVVGWKYFNKNKENTGSSQPNTSQTTPDPSEGGKYLVIKEWGVRIKKGEKTQDLEYGFFNPEVPDSIMFGLASFSKKYPSCSPENTGLSRGLARSKNKTDLAPFESFTEINGYHYAVISGGASCLDSNASPEEENLFESARIELSSVLRTLEETEIIKS